MLLVHQRKQGHGKWEVAWTWMPYFLAADTELIKHVDQGLTKEFKGTTFDTETPEVTESIVQRMHEKVLDLIEEKYPMPGLRHYLSTISHVQPEKEPEQ